MRWQYAHLNETPYLYSSKHLKQMHEKARSKDETEAMWGHMQKHEVDDYEYKGYYNLARQIQEELHGEETVDMERGDIFEDYKPVMTKDGLKLEKRRKTDGQCKTRFPFTNAYSI
ncbi:hypothetical protein [Bacillus pseudomycoides]|uniref:hypothetical protein n=1 Tax=Bacillus pseudomycoides TaxID=64104 RepID=UPI000BFD2EB6|nr:hypothetical protein [Bacillus pseudomycoides]PHB18380.1 hypothetical protein COE85_17890 [Bacillus pseudomycoides]